MVPMLHRTSGRHKGESSVSSTSTSVEFVRSIYAAFNSGDIEAVRASFDEEIEWVEPACYHVPEARGVLRGRDRVMAIFELYPDYWERYSPTPEEFHDAGNGVVFVVGHVQAKALNGHELQGSIVNMWQVADDRAIAHRSWSDTKLVDDALRGDGHPAVDAVRRFYEAVNLGDLDAVVALLDPDIDWGSSTTLPWGRRVEGRRGHAAVVEYLSMLGEELDAKARTEEIFSADGNCVVALGLIEGTACATGKHLECRFAHLFRLRDGRVTWHRGYPDTAAVLEAMAASDA